MKLEIKKKLLTRSERVKSVELHPTLPWVLIALYAGNVTIYDYNQQTQVRSFEVTNAPVRCAKFIARKQWIIVGADDTKIRVFNYNTSEKLKVIEEHTDFIRYLAVHPQLPYVLSCSDDQTIKLYDWDKNWQKMNSYEDHDHYIMQIAINPKDPSMFASASLDRTIKIWTISAGGGANKKSNANYSLIGHQAGVNCLDFSIGFDRPHLVSGGDDGHVKVWDYQTKQCLFTFDKGHTDNVSAVSYHPDLPIIMSAGEDNIINIWNAITFKLETFLNYGLQRVWAIHALPQSNYVAFGFDEATVVIKIGKESPMASFNNGRVVWVKQSEIQTVNLKLINEELKDGEKLKPIVKDLGHSETFPQSIKFSPNGRFFAICGDNDFVVYQYPKFSNAGFGSGNDLVWATVNQSQNIYAVKSDSGLVKVYKNFAEHKAFKTNFQNEGIFGGRLLAIKSKEFVTFYDWEDFNVIRRIDLNQAPKNVYWSENGQFLVLALEETFYLLQFNNDVVEQVLRRQAPGEGNEEDGIDDAFTPIEEFNETIISGQWISSDCFVFVNSKGMIQYLIGNKILKLTNTDKKYFILGYDSKQNRLYLVDKALNIVSYQLLIALVNYQSAIMNEDVHGAQAYFKDIPEVFHSKLAKFLEANNQKELAFEITPDKDHKFDLALSLNKIEEASIIAEEQESTDKWKKVGDIALMNGCFELAEKCFDKSQDYNSLLLFYSSYGDEEGMRKLVEQAEKNGKYNVALEAAFLLGDAERCINILLKAKRVAEAAMFARAYAPSKVGLVMKQWEETLKQRELPFQPENILKSDQYKDIIGEALRLEEELNQKFHLQPKAKGEEFENVKVEYHNAANSQVNPNHKLLSVVKVEANLQQSQQGIIHQVKQKRLTELRRSLGKGTFGKVKLATHLLTGEKVAVKILEKDKIKDKKDVERITREIKILKKVRHPNVIQLYEIIETEQELYLIMEYCPNGELFDYIVSHQRLQEKQACKFYQELLCGIEYIHKSGICHRDLKPENLLLDFDKTLKIVDFGLSNMYEDGETLKTACGSPCYAAPEMIAGKRYLGLRTDIWSSGVILFAMVCGFLPFEDPKTSNLYKKILSADYQIPKFVSTECADLMQKILNTNPESRYTLEEIRNHPWYRQVRDKRNSGLFPGTEKMPITEQIYKQMMTEHKFDPDYSIKCIEANRHNQITATYHLLYKKALRQNKQISDTPLQGTGSIDRGNQPKHTRAQRQEIGEVHTANSNRRGQSQVAGAVHKQDLNQTLPAQLYAQQLQSVNGGDEVSNFNNQQEITAQKKYKMQLQAEINKLKQKYQQNTNGQGAQGVQGVSNNDSSINGRKSIEQASLSIQLGNDQQKMVVQSNAGEHSPSPDHMGFVQNLQQQLSSISKNTNTGNSVNSNGTNSKFYQTGVNFHTSKLPSASNHESTSIQTKQSMGTTQNNPLISNPGSIVSHHQRFKTQHQIGGPTTTVGGLMGNQNMNGTSVLGQLPASFDQTRIKLQGGKQNITMVPQNQQQMKMTQGNWKHNFVVNGQGANPQAFMGGTTYIQKSSYNNNEISTQQSTYNSAQKSNHVKQHSNTINLDESQLPSKAKNSLFNSTMANFSTVNNPAQSEKYSSVTYKRGKTSSIDQGNPNEMRVTTTGARISATQQLNMSAIIPNKNNPFNQTNDYAYPIGSQSPGLGSHSQQSSAKQNKTKINDLSLQMANLDFSTIKVPRTSNPTGQNKISNDIIASRQGTAASQVKQRSTMRYSVQGAPNDLKQNLNHTTNGSVNRTQQVIASNNLNDSTTMASANLNISELYKQYQKKQGGNNGGGQSVLNSTQLSISQVRPPGQHKSQPRAVSVIDNGSSLGNQGVPGGGQTSQSQQQQQMMATFSNRHGSQSQNKKANAQIAGKY